MRLVVLCCLAGLLLAAHAACPTSTGSTLWSQAYGSVAAGADVTVNGDVWLDVSTPALGVVTIPAGSGLYFSYKATTPLVLNATSILVYGQLCVGSPSNRFPGDATITLYGDPAPGTQGTNNFGAKVIGVAAGATLGLYGQIKTPWTRLSQTAQRDYYTNQGPTQISVTDSVNWQAGDTVLVVSTDMPNRVQSERMTVTSISGGKTINFNTFLRYTHYGEVYVAGGNGADFVDMRGEVGVLNRNVRVVGFSNNDADTWGAHVHIIGTAVVQIDNAEFIGTGQTAGNTELTRYSIFFDNCGDMTGSYVVGSSFHDTMRGAVGLGKTSFLTIKDNVAFNCSGHIFFVGMLGVAQGNNIVHNLAVYARTNDPWGNTAAGFHCGYANNTWTDNSAVESSLGYWFNVPGDQIAAATQYGSDFWPRYVQLGVFRNNYAHGISRDGINTASYSPRLWTIESVRSLNGTLTPTQINNMVSNRPFSSAIFSDSHIYKCESSGIWSDGQNIQFQRFHLSDNRYGIGFTGIGLLFENTVIVGDSPNAGTPLVPDYEQGRSRPNPYSPDDPVFGVWLVSCCEPAFFVNIRFYNYNDFPFKFVTDVRLAAAIGPEGGDGVSSTDHRFYRAGFSSVQRRVLVHPDFTGGAVRAFSLTDIDGSLTDGVTGGGCGARVLSSTPALYGSSCAFQSQWNAYLCPPSDGFPNYRRVTFDDPNNVILNITSTAAQGILTRLDSAQSALLDANPETGGFVLEYDTNVVVNTEYMIEFGSVGETPDVLRITLYDYMAGNFYTAQGGEWIRIAIPYPSNANFTVAFGSTALSAGASRAAVNTRTYFWDQANNLLWVAIAADKDDFAYYNGIPFPQTQRTLTITADCPTGCITPSPARPSSTAAPGNPTFARCLANSDGYLGWANGIPTFSASGGGDDIFVDALGVGWSSNDNTYLLTNALPFTPAFAIPGVAIWFNWTNFQSTGFYSNNGPLVGSNTHISFRIRSDPALGIDGVGQIDAYVCLFNEGSGRGCVDLNNPWYSAAGPVGSDAWYSVYVPIADFGSGFAATNRVNQVRFGHNQARSVSVYVDDVRLGAYTVNFVRTATPVTNAAAATTSSTSGNSRSKKAPVGAIVGGVIGGIVVLAIIVALVVFFVMKGGFAGMKEFAARTSRSQPRWAA